MVSLRGRGGKQSALIVMGVEQFVHGVVHGLGVQVLVDAHDDRVLVRTRQTHALAELVVLVETGLTGLDDDAATGDQVTDGPTADGDGADAETADFQKAATTQNQCSGALGVIIIFRQHFYNLASGILKHAAAGASWDAARPCPWAEPADRRR